MRYVTVDKRRVYEVPDTWAEAERMIAHSMRYHDGRGGHLSQTSVAARVVYGLYGKELMAADPTQALMFLLQTLCKKRWSGLAP